MKIRTDFISNSSSSSFVIKMTNISDISKYLDMIFKKRNKKFYFDYVLISSELSKKYKIITKIKRISTNDTYIIDTLSDGHGMNIDFDHYIVVEFSNFIKFWKSIFDLKLKNKILKSVEYLVSETCWGIHETILNDNIEDFKLELQKFLKDNDLEFSTDEAFV